MGLFNKGTSTSYFFVWYLGSKEANGIRGHSAALPAMRYLLNDSFTRTPNKATLQVSDNGLKLTQTLPIMCKNGRIKSRRVKLQIAANSITYSMIGEAPFDDIIAVIIVTNNPEMSSPIHVHCYRCDNNETTRLLYDSIQEIR
uniref:PID domain-containing protein n=1 Tax=Ascaris lumbricoides TaxID=6252 RepID=A0A0M3IAW9_ASCLU